jgi:hypothetical protein
METMINPMDVYNWSYAVAKTIIHSSGGWTALRRLYYDIRHEDDPNTFLEVLARDIADLRFSGIDVAVKKELLNITSTDFRSIKAAILTGFSAAFPPSERGAEVKQDE